MGLQVVQELQAVRLAALLRAGDDHDALAGRAVELPHRVAERLAVDEREAAVELEELEVVDVRIRRGRRRELLDQPPQVDISRNPLRRRGQQVRQPALLGRGLDGMGEVVTERARRASPGSRSSG